MAVTVAAPLEGPRLISKNDYFAAPMRNDVATSWMKERRIEAVYRG